MRSRPRMLGRICLSWQPHGFESFGSCLVHTKPRDLVVAERHRPCSSGVDDHPDSTPCAYESYGNDYHVIPSLDEFLRLEALVHPSLVPLVADSTTAGRRRRRQTI